MSDLLSAALFESGLDEFLQTSSNDTSSPSIYDQPSYIDDVDSCVHEEVVITQPGYHSPLVSHTPPPLKPRLHGVANPPSLIHNQRFYTPQNHQRVDDGATDEYARSAPRLASGVHHSNNNNNNHQQHIQSQHLQHHHQPSPNIRFLHHSAKMRAGAAHRFLRQQQQTRHQQQQQPSHMMVDNGDFIDQPQHEIVSQRSMLHNIGTPNGGGARVVRLPTGYRVISPTVASTARENVVRRAVRDGGMAMVGGNAVPLGTARQMPNYPNTQSPSSRQMASEGMSGGHFGSNSQQMVGYRQTPTRGGATSALRSSGGYYSTTTPTAVKIRQISSNGITTKVIYRQAVPGIQNQPPTHQPQLQQQKQHQPRYPNQPRPIRVSSRDGGYSSFGGGMTAHDRQHPPLPPSSPVRPPSVPPPVLQPQSPIPSPALPSPKSQMMLNNSSTSAQNYHHRQDSQLFEGESALLIRSGSPMPRVEAGRKIRPIYVTTEQPQGQQRKMSTKVEPRQRISPTSQSSSDAAELKDEKGRPIVTEEDEIEQIQVDTYVDYFPPKLRSGLAHPDSVVETVSLSSVSSPEIRYHMSIPEEVVDVGQISALQLEAALYACQAHENRLPTGERVGYLVGDGAGVGKGRIIATIIYENYILGRRRAIWLSVSSDLKFDAERDLCDIGATGINVYALNKLKYAKINGPENGHIKKGVLFSTYASLIGECRSAQNTPYSSRLKQVLQWCGKDFDGVIVFDECHRAKNLCPSAGKSTKTGKFVLELQRALPSARIVYASATGATEPRNMAYMTRLGLWGQGQTFQTFNDFIHAVENRGVGAMEMVAMDMKLRGLYLARQLSFKGVGFRVEEVDLNKQFIEVYDESVKVWMECRRQFARALSHMPNEMPKNQKVWAQFWSAHQRFFKYLCISAKVDTCVKIALEAIADGKCVVIGLQSTGESQMLDFLEDNGEVTEFVSTAKAVLQGLVEKHFPSYDDNHISAMDDFERMFMSMDDIKTGKKRKHTSGDLLVKKLGRRAPSLELGAERESGGNSEVDGNDLENDDSDDYEDASSSDDDDDDDSSEAEEEGDQIAKDKAAEDLVDALMAELSSDDESDENSRQSADSAAGRRPSSTVKTTTTMDSEFAPALSFDPIAFGEVNPFCMDLTREDPWAFSQRNSEDAFSSPSFGKSKVLLDATLAVKAEEKAQKRKIKRAKRKKKKASAISQTGAKEFIKSTNLIGDSDGKDGSLNLTEIKTDLLATIEKLGKLLPSNTLDQLINQLGGPHYVAEMTGRRGRVITKEETGKVQYELRNADSDAPVEYMNMEEKEKFMNGEKLVAIISEAASSGISLQSDRRANNHRRRVHITLELPWSADKAVQQFGRTHRSNQVSAPEYLFLISELAGEKRFASIVAKRLESLGALTHGDRRATETRDLSQFNIDTKYGREALEILFKTVVGGMEPVIPPPTSYTAGDFFLDMRMYMEGVGLLSKVSSTYIVERDAVYIPKFLNRLLGLPVNAQNTLFQYFSDIVAELIKQAKLDGTYDMGIMDIGMGSDRVQKAETRKFEGSVITNDFHVEMHKISLHRGVSWDEALAQLQLHRGPNDGFYVSSVGFQKRTSVALLYGIGKTYDGTNHRFYAVTRPNTGRSPKSESLEELRMRFRPISVEDAKTHWEEQYEKLDQQCHHRYYHGKCNNESQGRFCEVGRRTRTYFVLSGSVICVWPALEEILVDGKNNKHRRMQIVRVRTDTNQKVIGLLVLPIHVRKLVELLEQRCKS